MPHLTPEVFGKLWAGSKRGEQPEDPVLAAILRLMVMHEGLHDVWEKLAADPNAETVVEGEDVCLHIAMDMGAERAIQLDQPAGTKALMQYLVDSGVPGMQAFHLMSAALRDETLAAQAEGRAPDIGNFLPRAHRYAEQLRQRMIQEAGGAMPGGTT